MNRVFFEVITKTEVAQHLKERVMERRASHVIDIARAETFLASRRSSEVQLDLSQKMVFELIHSCWSKQHGGVPRWNQHITGTANTTLGFKELKVFFT